MSSREHERGSAEGTERALAPTRWRFLVDEKLPHDLAVWLRTMGYVAEHVHVVNVGLRGQPDVVVFAYGQTHGETLIATDLGFGNVLH